MIQSVLHRLLVVLLALPPITTAHAASHSHHSEDALAREILAIRSSIAAMPTEISIGCNSAPLPTVVGEPSFSAVVDDPGFGTPSRFRMTAWRKSCSEGDQQLMLTLTPTSGSTSFQALFSVVQGSRSFNVNLVTNEAGSPASGSLPETRTYLMQAVGGSSSTFDDDGALAIRYTGLIAPTVSLAVPAAVTAEPPPPTPPAINDRMDGGWYNPAASGQGFYFDADASRGILAGGWYTAHPNVPGQREWYSFLSTEMSNGVAQVLIYQTNNVEFVAPTTPATTAAIGTGTITFSSCTSAAFEYNLPGLGKHGSIPLTKLTGVSPPCD